MDPIDAVMKLLAVLVAFAIVGLFMVIVNIRSKTYNKNTQTIWDIFLLLLLVLFAFACAVVSHIPLS